MKGNDQKRTYHISFHVVMDWGRYVVVNIWIGQWATVFETVAGWVQIDKCRYCEKREKPTMWTKNCDECYSFPLTYTPTLNFTLRLQLSFNKINSLWFTYIKQNAISYSKNNIHRIRSLGTINLIIIRNIKTLDNLITTYELNIV